MRFEELVGNAILGIDTLWGGDVMCPSGTGRFIADSWFSDEPLPVGLHPPDRRARARNRRRIRKGTGPRGHRRLPRRGGRARRHRRPAGAATHAGLRGEYLRGLATSFEVMWDLVMERLGKGEPVPYERCVRGLHRRGAHALRTAGQARARGRTAGARRATAGPLLDAVDAWRRDRRAPMAAVRPLSDAVIALFDRLTERNVAPWLPAELSAVPRANIDFLPIKEAWFSGSMNYLGRARRADGSPEYEATYEINASLEISLPEFFQLISHEVVPGHVTTFAYLQNLWVRGQVGFEATVLTMNTRAAALFEGIANNAILMAYGVKEVEELPDEDLQTGVLLALLQDDAKNQSSYLTWKEGLPQPEVAAALRRDFLVSRGTRGQALGRVGKASAARPHVPARVSRGHRARRGAAPPLSRRRSCCPCSSAARDWWTCAPSRRC